MTIEETVVRAKRIKPAPPKGATKQDALSIDKLKYNFNQGARTNRFAVNLRCPTLEISLDAIRCINATLPGRLIETSEASEYGPPRKMPYGVSMDNGEASFTFLCDSSFADRFLIESWQGFIFGLDDLSNPEFVNQPTFSYYNEYIGEVEIQQLTNDDKDALVYKLHDAYPVSFSAQELSYETTDDIMRFECTFAFRTFTTEYRNPISLSGLNRGSRALSAFNDLLGVFGKGPNKKITKFAERLNRLSGIID